MNNQEAMTLDEAIIHAREIAKDNREICTTTDIGCDKFSKCHKCAEEHEQLADWLEELKQYKELGTLDEIKSVQEDWVHHVTDMVELNVYRSLETVKELRDKIYS